MSLRLHRDAAVRAVLPGARAAATMFTVAFVLSGAFLVFALSGTGPVHRAAGVLTMLPSLLILMALGRRLGWRLQGGTSAFWRAMTYGCCAVLAGVVILASEGWVQRPVQLIAEVLVTPLAVLLFGYAVWKRRQGTRGRAGVIGFFDMATVLSVVTAYLAFVLVVPLLDTSRVESVLGLFVFLMSLFMMGLVLRLVRPRRPDGDIRAESVLATALCGAVIMALVTTILVVLHGWKPSVDSSAWLFGVPWTVVWVFGCVMAYCEASDVPETALLEPERQARPFWPYAVMAVMPPLAVAAVFVDRLEQKLAAIVGFLVVLEVLVARQLVLVSEQRRVRERRHELARQAATEAARTQSLLDAALALSAENDPARMCYTVAGNIGDMVPVTCGIVVLAASLPASADVVGAAIRLPQPRDPTRLWHRLDRAVRDDHVPLEGDAVRACLDDTRYGRLWLVPAIAWSGARLGLIGIATTEWAPEWADSALLAGFADQLALAVERSRLVNGLRASSERVRNLAENITEAVADVDADMRVIACNSAFGSILGVPSERLTGNILPLDVIRRGHLQDVADRVRQGETEGELQATQPDGREHVYEYAIVSRVTGDGERAGAGEVPRALVVLRDVSESRDQQTRILRLYRELQAKERSRADLLEKVLASAEQERRRLAHDVHEGPVESMSALGLRLDAAVALAGEGPSGRERSRTLLREVRSEMGDLVMGLRRLMANLRPPVLDERGLGPALDALGRRVAAESGLRVRTDVSASLPRLDGPAETLLYRVAQEALDNVVRHASASRAVLSLRPDGDGVALEIADDGRGCGVVDASALARFTSEGRVGMAAMYERMTLAGGGFDVFPGDAGGTCVRASLPGR